MTRKEMKQKIHAASFETVKQEKQDIITGKTYGSEMALSKNYEAAAKNNQQGNLPMQTLWPKWSSKNKECTLPILSK